jgi:hypothetical protein
MSAKVFTPSNIPTRSMQKYYSLKSLKNDPKSFKNPKSLKKQKSLKTQVVVEDKVKMLTSEMILECSIESLYEWLRFKKFPTVPTQGLKDLFIKMVNVPLKHEMILHEIINVINRGSFEELVNLIDKYHISDLYEQLAQSGIELKFKHDWKKVFELYFSTNDENLATAILRNFMFIESVSQEAYECYIKWVENLSEEERKMNLIQYPYNRITV